MPAESKRHIAVNTGHRLTAEPNLARWVAFRVDLSGTAQANALRGHIALGGKTFSHQPLRQAGIEAVGRGDTNLLVGSGIVRWQQKRGFRQTGPVRETLHDGIVKATAI